MLGGSRLNAGEVRRRFSNAVEDFLADNRNLFELQVGERVLVSQLRSHLAHQFKDWDVDAEYNRHGAEPKYLARYRELLLEHNLEVPENPAPRSIDIVVHSRGDDERNLLAVEVKRSVNCDRRILDCLKLRALREELGYTHTVFVEFGPDGERVEECWESL